MRKTSLLALASLVLMTGGLGHAQPYSNAVMALNPAAYWPLQETTPPPNGYYLANNLGTLGATANGYYGTWYQPNGTGSYPTNNIQRTSGATGDGDLAMQGNGDPTGRGQYVIFPRATNGVVNPSLTLRAPFTIEAWVKSGNTNISSPQMIVNEGRNAVQGDATATPPYTNTFRGFSLGQYKNAFFFQLYNATRNANGGHPEIQIKNVVPNVWYHVVATYDGTTSRIYANGVLAASATTGYVPDLSSPLLIGTGTIAPAGNGCRVFLGALDEVAIYPVELSEAQIQAHYAAAAGTTYAETVQADQPTIYLRLNEPLLTTYPSPDTYPVANNYGLLGTVANGLYQPGTAPGVAGPAYSGFGPASRAVAFNSFYGTVDVGGGSLPAELNPQGTNSPFTVMTWFQGNPADAPARFQVLMGHSDRSWRLTLDGAQGATSNTNSAGVRFNPGNGPELGFTNTADAVANGFLCNDGQWHMAAGVFDGTNDSLYLDGVLVKTGTKVGSIVGTNLNLMLGGDPQYTVPAANSPTLPNFNGQLAHAAFFTNALSTVQIQQLYNVAGVPPSIVQQPQSLTNNAGANLALTVAVRGSAPFSYQWYKGTAPVAGATGSSLAFNPALATDSGSYFVVVTNAAGAVTSSVVQLTIYGPPVLVSQSPADVKVFVGTTPALRVGVTGPQPFSYQWSRNGSPISGATASTYTPSTASVGTSTYSCTVTNAYGSVSLSPITVAVVAAPTAPYPVAVLADHPVAFFRLNESAAPGNWTADGVTAYDYAGGLNATYTNSSLGQPGYTALTTPQTDTDTAVGFGSVASADSFAGNVPGYLNFATPAGGNAQFSIETWVNGSVGQSTAAGIVTLGYGNGGEQFNLDTGAAGGKYRFFVRTAADPASAKVANGTNAPNDGLWHHVVGVCDQANGQVLLYVDGVLNASGTIPANAGLLNPTAPMSIGSRQSGKGTSYDSQFAGSIDEVAVYNYALSPAQVAAHYVAAGVAPRFVQQPPSILTTNEGATVVISASAMGSPPIAYQWYKDGELLVGQTSPTLTLRNVTISQSGGYYLTANNAYSAAPVYSEFTTLTILSGPPILDVDLQPLSSTNYAGTPFTYSVSVSGSAPFTYQWYKNQTAIPGATGSSYSFNTTLGTSYYHVTVVNTQGTVTSSTATNVGVGVASLDPDDYSYKMKIAFPGYNRGETLADFPILVKFGASLPGFSYQQLASSTGGDLRFTDASGTRQIPHEIDEWNAEGTSAVWVQVPRLAGTNDPASTNNFIWAYWGNPAASSPLAWSTNGAVWVPQPFEALPAHQLVWHLKESALPYADSALQYPALTGTAPAPTAGIIGTAGAFNGAAFLDTGVITNLDGAFTLSAWVNLSPSANNIQTIWANKVGGWNANGFALYVNSWQSSDQQLRFENGNGTGGNTLASAPGAVTYGQWHLITAAIDRANGKGRLYVDGTDVTASGAVITDFANMTNVNLGRLTTSGSYFNGALDEVRIQSGTNSANWVWASYMTVAQNDTFQNYAPISSSLVAITYQSVNGNLVLSWPQGTLQVADQVNGTYTDLTTATSPYSVPLSATQKFYRVKVR